MPNYAPQQAQIPAPQRPQIQAQPNSFQQPQPQMGGQPGMPDMGQLIMMLKMKQMMAQRGQGQVPGQTPQAQPVPQASPVPGMAPPLSAQAGIPQAPAPNGFQSPLPQGQQAQSIGDLMFRQGGGR